MITFTGEGLPIGFDSDDLTIESIQLPFPTLIEVADSNEVYVFWGQPVALDIFVNAIRRTVASKQLYADPSDL